MKYTISNVVNIHNKLADIDGIEDYQYYITDDMPYVAGYSWNDKEDIHGENYQEWKSNKKILKYHKLASLEVFLFASLLDRKEIVWNRNWLKFLGTITSRGEYSDSDMQGYVYIDDVKVKEYVTAFLCRYTFSSYGGNKDTPVLMDFEKYKKLKESEIFENIRQAMLIHIRDSDKNTSGSFKKYVKKNVAMIECHDDMIDDLFVTVNEKDDFYKACKKYIDVPKKSNMSVDSINWKLPVECNTSSFGIDTEALEVTGLGKAIEEVKDDCMMIPMTFTYVKNYYTRHSGSTDSNYRYVWKKNNKIKTMNRIKRYIMLFKSKESVDTFFEHYKMGNKLSGIDILAPYMCPRTMIERRNVGVTPLMVKYFNHKVTSSVNEKPLENVTYSRRKTFFDKDSHRSFMEIQSSPIILSANITKFYSDDSVHGEYKLKEITDDLVQQDILGIRKYIEKMKDTGIPIVFNTRYRTSTFFYNLQDHDRIKIPSKYSAYVSAKKPNVDRLTPSHFAEFNGMDKNYKSNGTGRGYIKRSEHVDISYEDIDKSVEMAYKNIADDMQACAIRERNSTSAYYTRDIKYITVMSYFSMLVSENTDLEEVKKILKKEKLLKLGNAFHVNAYTFLDEEKNIDSVLDVLRMI